MNNQGPSPQNSSLPRAQHKANDVSHPLQELSQSILGTPQMMSNFARKRGFLGVDKIQHLVNNRPIGLGAPADHSST